MAKLLKSVLPIVIIALITVIFAGCGGDDAAEKARKEKAAKDAEISAFVNELHNAETRNKPHIPEEQSYFASNFPYGKMQFVYVDPDDPKNMRKYEGRAEGIFIQPVADNAPVMKTVIVQYVRGKFNGVPNHDFEVAKSILPTLLNAPYKTDVEAHLISDSEAFVYVDNVIRINYDKKGEKYTAYLFDADEVSKYNLANEKASRESNIPARRVLAGVGDITDAKIFFDK